MKKITTSLTVDENLSVQKFPICNYGKPFSASFSSFSPFQSKELPILPMTGIRISDLSCWTQPLCCDAKWCDQIGQFLKGLGIKLSYKSSPNIMCIFKENLQRATFGKNG